MPEITLAAEVGRAIGTSDTRRLRHEGKIPGVIYGRGIESVPVAVDAKAFRQALAGDQGLNTLLDLVAGKQHYLVLAREIQRHPVRGTVNHVDFQVVSRTQGVDVDVPLEVVGDAVDVRHHDWEVDQQLFSIHVRAQPDKIPSAITVDISELQVGGAIRIGDLAIPEGVEATQDPQTTVIGTHAARVAPVAATPEEEGAVAAEEEGAPEAAPAPEET
jgi:large subunit ribosomal protein L25